ncbi:NAD(P)-dependent dehydrogenase (short-subunit alcohol dehydrogenase family) [Paraburkholderia sp. BL23I1N1]|uniref:SDR family oxidoreductase n=1 Tax=Paraburkholderia sp. BL23I1N1 TaxID=1938802 RepID=UPI000E7457E7|nr:SDR family NAD(P)-dependent oxidoreductase [Paraburkholderia sp. BL23I1N1]RKE38665.1 NAD(P)-dependent dehydrogenase (short-subunit alcohol dehydrogenase family) [Paraburkholderia sp. BL23I1N1]
MSNSTLLNGLRVAVTGAGGTVGQAVAREALQMGASVALIDMKVPEALRDLSGAKYYTADLTDEREIRQCFEEVGQIDALLNIAGGFAMGRPVHETSDADWDQMFDINVKTLLHCVRQAVPGMISRGNGRIVNIAAVSARRGQPLMAPYSASKSTIIRLTESMAMELREKGINVNCVLPSIVDTPANRHAMPDVDHSKWVSPVDLAHVVCFLASDHARAIHGASLPVTHLS